MAQYTVALLTVGVAALAVTTSAMSVPVPLNPEAPYPWRVSMTAAGSCWTDVACIRALVVSHGGDWTTQYPYDSLPAFQRAMDKGTDAIKGDFRVTVDNQGVVMHSSPVELYESIDCAGMIVENVTLAKATSCHMLLTNYTFISAAEMLAAAAGRAIVMFCVKRSQDIPRAISTLIENNATDRAFLEIKIGDLVNLVPQAPDWEQAWYLADGDSAEDISTFVAAPQDLIKRSFTFEFEPSYTSWGINATQVIESKLHPLGVRSLTATSQFLPSVKEQEGIFEAGFDVVYTYDLDNALLARTAIDTARNVTPPC